MSSGGSEGETWIHFNVVIATWFDLDHQPEPEQFLFVLDEYCDARRDQRAAQPSE